MFYPGPADGAERPVRGVYPGRVALALTNGDVILIVVLIAIPLAAIAFIANAGNAFKQIGKGDFAVEFDSDAPQPLRDSGAEAESAGEADDELRQLLEAKAYRQRARGETPVDVDAEFERLRAEQQKPAAPSSDPELREEVRQLVVARNERRARQGKEPLDVDAEIERQLRELENLGQ
jgi:hypothetical protein